MVTGTGYTASVDYVVKTLQKAGYKPKVTPFNFPFWEETQPAVMRQTAPQQKTYRYGTEADDGSPDVDYITMAYSPTKSVTGAKVVPTTDVTIPPAGPGTSTSGCEASDYPAAVKGAIALIQRGTCAFVDKAAAAQAAGAAGAIIFNDGANADRQNPVFISDAVDLDIPVVVSSFAVGKELYDAYQAGRRRRSTSPPTASCATATSTRCWPRPRRATRITSRSSARTSTRSRPARASTTTAPARRRC